MSGLFAQCRKSDSAGADSYLFECNRCGRFSASRLFVAATEKDRDGDWRWRLSCAIREMVDLSGELRETVTVENYEIMISRARRPANPMEQIARFLLSVADRTPHLGAQCEPDYHEAWAARMWLPDWKTCQRVTSQIVAMGLILANTANEGSAFTLTLGGWQRVTDLRRTVGTGSQAFVAMWFDKAMDPLYDDAVAPALREVGYEPYRVDRDPHDRRIDDKIVAELRRSRIVLADCTGARPSVYFEAGLAYGLGLEVIWSCFDPTLLPAGETAFAAPAPDGGQKAWFEQLSFDTRQYTCLGWATLPQLQDLIVNRVRARGLDRPSAR